MECDIDELVGKTLASVTPHGSGYPEEVEFVTTDGDVFLMRHEQDCCEIVVLYEVVGDVSDLVGSPILKASEDTQEAKGGDEGFDCDSGTWTFYNIRTVKGAVTLRWLGESNGYYSEEVSFYRHREAQP